MDTLFLFSKPGFRKAIGPYLLLHLQHILPAFIILNVLLGCGNGKSGKIRLHARDSADVAMSGTWVVTAWAEQDSPREGRAQKDSVEGFMLNEDHSALVYARDRDSVKEVKARWRWNKDKKTDTTTSSIAKDDAEHAGILIFRGSPGDSVIVLNLTTSRQSGETLLNSPGLFSFRKEK